jgi:hypothetical protein
MDGFIEGIHGPAQFCICRRRGKNMKNMTTPLLHRHRIPLGIEFLAMVLFLVLPLGAKAAVDPGEERVRLLVMDLSTTEDQKGQALAVAESLTAALAEEPYFNVVSGQDLRRMLELEANKTLLGCDAEACLSEIAGALDAQWVVFGSYRPLGSVIRTDLTLYDAKALSVVRRIFYESENIADAVKRAPQAATRLTSAYEESQDIFTLRHINWWPWALAGTGLLSFGGGVAVAFVAGSVFAESNQADAIDTPAPGPAPSSEVDDDNTRAVDTDVPETVAYQSSDPLGAWGVPLLIGGTLAGLAGFALTAIGVGWMLSGDGIEETE